MKRDNYEWTPQHYGVTGVATPPPEVMAARLKEATERRAKIVNATCCKSMADAMQAGSDNEGYSTLANWDGGWRFGSDLPSLVCCPWCKSTKIATMGKIE